VKKKLKKNLHTWACNKRPQTHTLPSPPAAQHLPSKKRNEKNLKSPQTHSLPSRSAAVAILKKKLKKTLSTPSANSIGK
jgi:hypothetical protein